MQIHATDMVIVVGYFLVMIWIGVYFSRRIVSIGEYFGGGGRVPWWLSSVSFYMTTFSAFSFVIYSEIAYRDGLVAMTLFYMSAPAAFLTGYIFAARWHGAARTSALEFVEERYSFVMRQGLAWLNIPLRLIDSGLKLFAIGTLLAGLLTPDPDMIFYAILFSGIIIFVYTFLGGLWGVLVTDFVQAIVMLFAVAVLVPLALMRTGGFGPIIENAPEGYFHLTRETQNIPYLLAWTAILFLNYSSAWSLVQRFYSVETKREARKVAYGVGGLLLITPPLIFIPAFAARIFIPGLEGAELTQVYALLCRELLPVGMVGLMMAAMFAATMSMLSSDYNAMSSVMTNDVYRGVWRKDASPQELLWVGRLTTLLIGSLCLGFAMLLLTRPDNKTLFDVMVSAFSYLLPPLAIPILAGIVSRRVSNVGAIVGLLSGSAVAIFIFLLVRYSPDWSVLSRNYILVPITAGTTILGLVIGTLLAPARGEARARIDAFFENAEAPRAKAAPSASGKSFKPLQISGLCVAFLGIVALASVLPVIGQGGAWITATVAVAMAISGGALWITGARILGDSKHGEATSE